MALSVAMSSPSALRVPVASSSSRMSSFLPRSSFIVSVPGLKNGDGLTNGAFVCNNTSSSTLVVECSSRPQKKCTAHHNKTRPKKHNPYDKNRKPPQYPPPPKAPPIALIDTSDPNPNPTPAASAS